MIAPGGMSLEESVIRREHLRPCERAIYTALRSGLVADAVSLAAHRDAILEVIERHGTAAEIPPIVETPGAVLDLASPQDARRVASALSRVSMGGSTTVALSTGPMRVVVRAAG